MNKLIVCDYPSAYTFPSVGSESMGSSEKRLWEVARTATTLPGLQVILTGPLWLPEHVPGAEYFPQRLDETTLDEFLQIYGQADYLFAGHEYFDKENYQFTFSKVARHSISYQLHPYDYEGKVVFDGRHTHLFCYSDEMMERYSKQSPRKLLLYHTGVDEVPFLTEEPDPYLLWMGRIDGEKAPHLAILAAREIGLPIHILGKTVYDQEYSKIYHEVLNLPHVVHHSVLYGRKKMSLISRASCGIYTLAESYSEAGAAVLGEMLTSGIPIAGISWRGNDAICEAVASPKVGRIARISSEDSEKNIVLALATAIEECRNLSRKEIFEDSKVRFDMRRLVSEMLTIVEMQ